MDGKGVLLGGTGSLSHMELMPGSNN